MSDSHDDPQTGVNATAIILPIVTVVLILSIIPPAIILICVRIAHPEYFNRGEPHEGDLPTTEQPTDKRTHHNMIFRRARVIVLRVRGLAIVAGEAIALRSHEVYEKDHGSCRCSRKRNPIALAKAVYRYTLTGKEDYLPIMLNKSWQTLAESHTELTWTDSQNGGLEHETIRMVETSKKPTINVHLDPGYEENKEPSVQKPETAVVADVKA